MAIEEENDEAVSGATVIDRPSANSSTGGNTSGSYCAFAPILWNSSRPPAATSGPARMKKRDPKRSASAPKRRERKNITSVTGNSA